MGFNLLRSHVSNRAGHIARALIARTLPYQRNAKVTQQYLVGSTHQEVFGLDITVDQLVLVSILQGWGNLPHIGQHCRKRQARAFGVQLAQGPIGCIVHHQKRRGAFHTKVQHTYDMRMDQVSNGAGFATKLLDLPASQLSMQHFDGCLGLQIDMLTQVHLGEASLA